EGFYFGAAKIKALRANCDCYPPTPFSSGITPASRALAFTEMLLGDFSSGITPASRALAFTEMLRIFQERGRLIR
ncbi:MAG: hypothetical protein Q8S20_03945, partial [Sulfuritalea sp.]|nr:hypothetical protein [Sulfuritalea sp.]